MRPGRLTISGYVLGILPLISIAPPTSQRHLYFLNFVQKLSKNQRLRPWADSEKGRDVFLHIKLQQQDFREAKDGTFKSLEHSVDVDAS